MTYKDARKKAGLSMTKAASLLNVSRNTLWLWESGRGNPLIGNLVNMARLYDVSLSELDIPGAPPPKTEEAHCAQEDTP